MWAILDTISKTPITLLPHQIGSLHPHQNDLTIVPPTQTNPSVESNDIALKIENLSKIYDSGAAGKVVALRKINFTIKKGEFVSIVGPSGSGKSTLLNMVGALDRPTVGKVFIDGIDIFSLKDSEIAKMRSNLIGFIFQSYNLINRTIQRNVELPATYQECQAQTETGNL